MFFKISISLFKKIKEKLSCSIFEVFISFYGVFSCLNYLWAKRGWPFFEPILDGFLRFWKTWEIQDGWPRWLPFRNDYAIITSCDVIASWSQRQRRHFQTYYTPSKSHYRRFIFSELRRGGRNPPPTPATEDKKSPVLLGLTYSRDKNLKIFSVCLTLLFFNYWQHTWDTRILFKLCHSYFSEDIFINKELSSPGSTVSCQNNICSISHDLICAALCKCFFTSKHLHCCSSDGCWIIQRDSIWIQSNLLKDSHTRGYRTYSRTSPSYNKDTSLLRTVHLVW